MRIFTLRITSVIIFLISAIAFFVRCNQQAPRKRIDAVHKQVQNKIDLFENWLMDEWIPLAEKNSSKSELQQNFLKGHALYKEVEWAVEYFFPTTAQNINGAPLPEIEAEENTVIEPIGFQVIEGFIFPAYDTTSKSELLRESKKLKSIVTRLQNLWAGNKFRDDQVFDALRLNISRVITLGISGFDMPVALQSVNEIKPSLNSVLSILKLYEQAPLKNDFDSIYYLINESITFAERAGSFNGFDRLEFITNYINPASRKIFVLQKKLDIPVLTGISTLRGDIATVFDEDAFDVNFFTPDANSHLSKEKIALGKELFYDRILSLNNKTSCASCHQPEKAFTDGLPLSIATGSKGFLSRNTPALINAGYQHGQFYDLRATFLEYQVKDVIQNKDEIHGSLAVSAKRLSADSNYVSLFRKSFSGLLSAIEPIHIQVALAAYIRSLKGFNSRFDLYMRGKTDQLSAEEKSGFNLFMGKAKCGTCHFMPLFNGTIPPSFTSSEAEVLGVPADKSGKIMDTDKGRYRIHRIPEFEYSFKTPTVRNAALTGPYMHNGVFTTLDEVMNFYEKGGGKGLGLDYKYQTLPEDTLGLTATEQKNIIAFLHSLTDVSAAKK